MNIKKIPPKAVPALLIFLLVAVVLIVIHEREKKSRITLYGNVDIRQIRSAFYSTGRIKQMHVHEGDAVTNGQLIAELDATRYEAAAAKAVEAAVIKVANTKLKSLAAGKMGYTTEQVGDLVVENL